MKKLKIGITIGLKSTDESIWTNGMKQNVLFLYKLLSHSVKNYDVWILNTTNLDLTEKPHAFKDVNIASLKDKHEEIDLLICMGSQVEQKYMEYFQNHPDKKVIGYRCGNNYVLAVEEMLFKEGNTYFEFEKEFDEVWYVPQQHETNVGFYKTLYRTEPVIVPFIWDHKFLLGSLVEIEKNFLAGRFKKSYKYDSTKEKKVFVNKVCLKNDHRFSIPKGNIELFLCRFSLSFFVTVELDLHSKKIDSKKNKFEFFFIYTDLN